MIHVTLDCFQGFRTRFDDVKLIQEFLETLPESVGVAPAMPPFLLPYYNGVESEDCGVSAFLFLQGGHVMIHTFSFREVAFLDLFSCDQVDAAIVEETFRQTFPSRKLIVDQVPRQSGERALLPVDPSVDFGPHLFMDLEEYRGPTTLDDLFEWMDGLPAEVGMTPIMRPYVLRQRTDAGRLFCSALTMIAESHVSLHVLPEERKAFFDLFSCSFFDPEPVVSRLHQHLPAGRVRTSLLARGRDYRNLRGSYQAAVSRSRGWLRAVRGSRR